MTSHELAHILLELPNLQVIESSENIDFFLVSVGEVVDDTHPDFVPFNYLMEPSNPSSEYLSAYESWYNKSPKKQVILI